MPGLWICLIIFYVQQAIEDALGSKYVTVLSMAQLYMQGLYIVLNMPEYGSICLSNAWICIMSPNVSKHGWILPNIRNLELALSIILKERELIIESKHIERRCLKIWDFLSFLICSSIQVLKITTSFANVARTMASTNKFIY